MAEFIVVAKPERTTQLNSYNTIFKCELVVAAPDAALVQRQFVIDSERAATRVRTETNESQYRSSGAAFERGTNMPA
jgi:hypothetical protein